MLEAIGIEKSYGALKVLKGVDLLVKQGEVVAVTGASGAGKSTLLHMLGTLDLPDKGKISIRGQDVLAQGSKALAAFRNKHIGFVFQFHNLLPEFSALENVMIPGLIAGAKDSDIKERASNLLVELGLQDRIHHKPSELSGGEQQRTAVARALINSPDIGHWFSCLWVIPLIGETRIRLNRFVNQTWSHSLRHAASAKT